MLGGGQVAGGEQAGQQGVAAARQGPRMVTMLVPLAVDVAVPVAAYFALHALGAGDFLALAAGGLVSAGLALVGVLRKWRLDGFALFILAVFGVGMLTTVLTGDVRFLLAKESFGTGLAGLGILASCALYRPFTFYSGRRFVCGGDRAREQWWHRAYDAQPGFRRSIRFMSMVWGGGLLAEALVRVTMAYTLPVGAVVASSPVLQFLALGGLIGWSAWYGRRMGRRSRQVVDQTRTPGQQSPPPQ